MDRTPGAPFRIMVDLLGNLLVFNVSAAVLIVPGAHPIGGHLSVT